MAAAQRSAEEHAARLTVAERKVVRRHARAATAAAAAEWADVKLAHARATAALEQKTLKTLQSRLCDAVDVEQLAAIAEEEREMERRKANLEERRRALLQARQERETAETEALPLLLMAPEAMEADAT